MPILTPEEWLGQDVGGRYRLDAVLSAGGMGVLFDAVDRTSGTAVAVKMLKPAYSLERDRVARFLRETKIAAELRHPNIALVLEVWQDPNGIPFLVMERLRGRSLEEALESRRTLPLSEALEIVLPVADALAHAHASGIIHRDVKPANIFLCEGSPKVVPKLLDFGIAKTPCDDFETQTGLVLGTPGYMAPEQAQHGECGPFTDIWAVGAVLYRALGGHPPHAAPSVGEMLAKLVREPVPPLVAAGVAKSVCATIDRALALDPHRRYADMATFVRALAGPLSHRAAAPIFAESTTQDLPRVSAEPASDALPRPSGASKLAVAGVSLALGVVLLARMPERSETRGDANRPAPSASERRDPVFAMPAAPERPSPATPPGVATPVAAVGPSPLPSDEGKSAIRTTGSPPGRIGDPAKASPARTKRAASHEAEPQRDPDTPETAVSSFHAVEPHQSAPRVEHEPNTGIPVATEW